MMTALFVVSVLFSWTAFILSVYAAIRSKLKEYTADAVVLLSSILILAEIYNFLGIK